MNAVHRLILRLAIFSLPFLLILAFPCYVMWRGGEFVSTEQVIRLQEKNEQPYMICAAYNDPWDYIKYRSAQNRGASILALGSSRVMMLRQTFFRDSFYNAARGINEIKDFRLFLKAMPGKARPRILILGLDPNFLNPGWVWSSSFPLYYEPSPHKEWLVVLGKKWVQLYWDFGKRVFDLNALPEKKQGLERIGLIAKVKDKGFLNDGSYFYQDFFTHQRQGTQEAPAKRFAESLAEAREGSGVYVPAVRISQERLKELEGFLREAQQMNMHVIGYVPPYAPGVFEVLRSRKQGGGFLNDFEKVVGPVFKKYGFSFVDLMDPAVLSATDDEFYDGEHDGGEVSARVVKTLAEKDPFLQKVVMPVIPPSDFIPASGTSVYGDADVKGWMR